MNISAFFNKSRALIKAAATLGQDPWNTRLRCKSQSETDNPDYSGDCLIIRNIDGRISIDIANLYENVAFIRCPAPPVTYQTTKGNLPLLEQADPQKAIDFLDAKFADPDFANYRQRKKYEEWKAILFMPSNCQSLSPNPAF